MTPARASSAASQGSHEHCIGKTLGAQQPDSPERRRDTFSSQVVRWTR